MSDYVIYTDSCCDLAQQDMKDWGVECCDMTFTFNGSNQQYRNGDLTADEFYRRMRAGSTTKTAAVNQHAYETDFARTLETGRDVLYICFSSGLSSSVNAARLAAEDLAEQYPERRVVVIDSLCASAGEGLLVYLAVQKQKGGASLEEVAGYLERTKLKLCHWFIVDDMKYLVSGGRFAAAAATVGSLIGIKPVLHVDNEGHLIFRYFVRGRKMAIRALAEEYLRKASDSANGIWFVSGADCYEDAKRLEEIIRKNGGPACTCFADIGPVIGGHTGPGTLSIFFLGKER